MIKVMFVCTGNVCRSPMAHYYMQKKVKDLGLENEFLISSCGTYAVTGEHATDNAIVSMKEYDVNLENKGKNAEEDALASLEGKNLKRLSLRYNTNLKWISYIKDINSLIYLCLGSCTNIVNEDMALIKDRILAIAVGNKEIPEKYLALFNTSDRLDYSTSNLNDESM